MATKGKTKKWSELTIKQQSKLEKEWSKIQNVREKAGQKPYSKKGKTGWLKAQNIFNDSKEGIVRATQRMKRMGRRFGRQ